MHMEPNHEGAASVPQTTGAPILPAERVYQDPSAPAGLKDKKEPSIPFTGVDACFAILALVCGYLFVWLVNPLALLAPYSLGVGVTIFAACFCTRVWPSNVNCLLVVTPCICPPIKAPAKSNKLVTLKLKGIASNIKKMIRP